MALEWDQAKAAANARKHGVDFADAATVLEDEFAMTLEEEHDDEGGWQARWLDRPTWDRAVTPNIRRRTGQRPVRPGRRRR